MSRSFHITTASERLSLNSSRQGEIVFTVSNALGKPMSSRAVIEPEGSTRAEWLSVEPAEREVTVDGTVSFVVRISVPPGTPEGTYSFHLLVVNIANPDEEYASGPSVGFQVPRPEAPRKKKPFPWWIPAAAAGVVVLLGLTLLWKGTHSGTGASGPSPLRFNGVTSFIDLGNPSYLNFSDAITLEAWIKPLANDGTRYVVAHGGLPTTWDEVALRIRDGKYEVGSSIGDEEYHFVSAPMRAGDVGQWVHLAGVYDGSRWILYRNGELLNSKADRLGVVRADARWTIGAAGGRVTDCFWGDIRDVRIWDVARTQQEIQAGMKKLPKGDEPHLLGAWPLVEGGGTSATDLSRNQGHGSIRDAQWSTPDAPAGLSFNGRDSYVSLGESEALNFTGPITIEAWIQPLSIDGTRNIVSRDEMNVFSSGVFLRIGDGSYQIGSRTDTELFAAVPVREEDRGQWVHLAGVHDGSQWLLYRNGDLVASAPSASGAVAIRAPWAIGSQSHGQGGRFFHGAIRDVRIWRIARTKSEIRADMSQPPGKHEAGLVGYWPLNEGKGSTARDLAGGAPGTIYSPLW